MGMIAHAPLLVLMRRWPVTGVALALCFALVACAPRERELHLSGKTMGTTWHATVVLNGAQISENDLRSMLQHRLDELDTDFTHWRTQCPVTLFNDSHSTDWQAEPRELVELVIFAQTLSRASDGAFDVTIAPLVDLWGFGAKGHVTQPPSKEAIAEAKKHVDWHKLEARLDPPALRKLDPEIQINVAAMADGYAVDELARIMKSRGVTHFLIEVGGAVYAGETNAVDQPWQVGIQHPSGREGDNAAAVPLKNQAISTSGVYRQFFQSDGKRYAHILDARTGRPVEHDLVSVSVIAPTAFAADGWDTTLLILGPERGRALAAERQLPAYFLAEPAVPR